MFFCKFSLSVFFLSFLLSSYGFSNAKPNNLTCERAGKFKSTCEADYQNRKKNVFGFVPAHLFCHISCPNGYFPSNYRDPPVFHGEQITVKGPFFPSAIETYHVRSSVNPFIPEKPKTLSFKVQYHCACFKKGSHP